MEFVIGAIFDRLIDFFIAVECSPGTYYDNDTRRCPQCDKGYYQDTSGQDSCVRCPDNTTTQFIGSKSISDCIGKNV